MFALRERLRTSAISCVDIQLSFSVLRRVPVRALWICCTDDSKREWDRCTVLHSQFQVVNWTLVLLWNLHASPFALLKVARLYRYSNNWSIPVQIVAFHLPTQTPRFSTRARRTFWFLTVWQSMSDYELLHCDIKMNLVYVIHELVFFGDCSRAGGVWLKISEKSFWMRSVEESAAGVN